MKTFKSFFIRTIFFIISISCTLFVSCKKEKSIILNAGFYKINQNVAEGIQKSLIAICSEKNQPINFVTINNEEELQRMANTGKVQFIFTSAGNAQRQCAEFSHSKAGLSPEVLQNVTTSVAEASVLNKNSKIIAVPLITDNIEIDVETSTFLSSDVKYINTWDDIEAFVKEQKRKVENPIVFAGADTINFFDLLGALCEAVDGIQYYNEALNILDQGGDPSAIAKALIGNPSSPMVKTGILLKQMIRSGYLNPVCFDYTTKDLEFSAKYSNSKVMLMSLSEHRNVNYNIINHFSSAYIPSERPASERTFTANITYAVPIIQNESLNNLISELLSDTNQELLSRNTGLSPVVRNCRTADSQSSDVRYWIAATNTPFAGLGHDTKLSEEKLSKIKDNIKGILLYE